MKGLVLLFNRKETEKGYPYTNIYNLIEVEEDKEEWAEDPYYVLRRSPVEIAIGSWEEQDTYDSRILKKVEKMNLKGKYLESDEMEFYHIYDAENRTSYLPVDSQQIFEHCLMELLSSDFLLRP